MATKAAVAPTPRATRDDINDFLKHKRFAMIGYSRDPKDFSRMMAKAFTRRGYQVLPVNPAMSELDGERCYARVQDIAPAVPAALLMTTPAVTEQVVKDCVAAGVTHIWMYRAVDSGAVSAKAMEYCREHGVHVVAGECPFMFLDHAGMPHNIHGWIKKLTGSFPK